MIQEIGFLGDEHVCPGRKSGCVYSNIIWISNGQIGRLGGARLNGMLPN
jgi:hypothetical protein